METPKVVEESDGNTEDIIEMHLTETASIRFAQCSELNSAFLALTGPYANIITAYMYLSVGDTAFGTLTLIITFFGAVFSGWFGFCYADKMHWVKVCTRQNGGVLLRSVSTFAGRIWQDLGS